MDWATIIISGLAGLAAVVSACVAVVQARSASRSERDAIDARNEARSARDESVRLAGEANDAFKRQARAQERANELEEEARRPPTWAGPRYISGQKFALTNTSGHTLKVEKIEAAPDGTEGMIRIFGPTDGVYKYGDSLEYVTLSAGGMRVQKLTLSWRRDDEPDAELREFIVPL